MMPTAFGPSLAGDLDDPTRRLAETWSIDCVLRHEGPADSPAVAEQGRVHLTRIVQEATANAVKHGGAGRVTVSLAVAEETDAGEATGSPDEAGRRPGLDAPAVVLRVVDDGRGLPPEVDGGIGMHTMRTRADLVGGTMTAGNTPEGTEVRVEIRRRA